jgi:GNAT superfamily N-acetyltransferase
LNPDVASGRGASRRLLSYIHDLATLPADLALAFRVEGWPGVSSEIADRSIKRVYRKKIVFLIIEQDLALIRCARPPAGVELRDLVDGEVALLAPIVSRRKLATYDRRLRAGRFCIAAFRNDQPIGYTWWTEEIDRSIEFYPIHLPADATYGWDLFVVPAERSNGIGSSLVVARLKAARARGFARSWRLTATTNAASLRTQEKTSVGGGRVLGRLEHEKVFRRDLFRFSGADGAEWSDRE